MNKNDLKKENNLKNKIRQLQIENLCLQDINTSIKLEVVQLQQEKELFRGCLFKV